MQLKHNYTSHGLAHSINYTYFQIGYFRLNNQFFCSLYYQLCFSLMGTQAAFA